MRAEVVNPLQRFAAQHAERWWPVIEAGGDGVPILPGFLADLHDAPCDNRDAVVAQLVRKAICEVGVGRARCRWTC